MKSFRAMMAAVVSATQAIGLAALLMLVNVIHMVYADLM